MMATFIQSQLFSKMAIAILFIYNLYIATVSSNPLPQFFFPKEVSFPDDETNDVRKCLNEDYSMPFFDFLTQQWVCHKLLTQGPCESDEWFVLSHNVSNTNRDLPQATCMARECPSIPVPEDNFVNFQERVMFNGVCTNVTSSKECKDMNMLVLINPFGEGECSCKDGYIEGPPKGKPSVSEEKKCYQKYLQGPCQPGYQLVPKEDVELQVTVNKRPLEKPVYFDTRPTQITFDDDDRDFLGSICIPSDCEKEGFVRLKNGKCLKPKSCEEDETVVFSTEFSNNINGTEIKFHEEDSQITTCCLKNDELVRRNPFTIKK